ncbi:MAG: Asp-tRNA(Asn)/Glu-tRNA(Gln) amidotransferase subunit GatA [Thioalkalivibrionaceae bacterium]
MSDVSSPTLSEWSQRLERSDVSSVELTEHFLARIDRSNGDLNGFVTVTAEQALAQARAADERRARGERGALLGMPIAHKDIFCTEGIRTACGSKMLDSFVAPYSATVVERMAQAGCVMLGKTNMDEFAMGSSNETSFYGPVANPWDLQRVPGGSSGGSAAVVAARLAPGASGTDTGGSIRQPAAFCGVTGLKPSYGLVSRYGMIAFASSLDQGGPMAASAEDCGHLLNVMAGFDPRDSTSIERPAEDYTARLGDSLQGLRVGLPKPFFDDSLDESIRARIDAVRDGLIDLGAVPVEVDLPNMRLSVPAYYVIAPAECSSNLARMDGVRFGHRCESPVNLHDLYCRSRAEGFGAEVKRRILVGTYVLSAGYFDAYYLKAQKVRRLIAEDFRRAFEHVDVLLGPTAPEVAFDRGAKQTDPVQMYLSDVYTIAINLAGLPALSMPAGFVDGLPVGAQLIGRYFDEARLLNIAHAWQSATDFHRRVPAAYAADLA